MKIEEMMQPLEEDELEGVSGGGETERYPKINFICSGCAYATSVLYH